MDGISSLVSTRKNYGREEIRQRLQARIDGGAPILAAGAGIGLVAKMAAAADIDLITATSEDRLRAMGLPSCAAYLSIGNANNYSEDALRRVRRMSGDVPVIAAVCPGDPYISASERIELAVSMGADGIISYINGNGFGSKLDKDVYGSILHSDADIKTVMTAKEKNLFTAGTAYDPEFAVKLAEAGADLIIIHCGYTAGGSLGVPEEYCMSVKEQAEYVSECVQAVKKIDQNIFVLFHGGLANDPETVQGILDNTGADGFYGGSVFDRIPVEKAIRTVSEQLLSLELLT